MHYVVTPPVGESSDETPSGKKSSARPFDDQLMGHNARNDLGDPNDEELHTSHHHRHDGALIDLGFGSESDFCLARQ